MTLEYRNGRPYYYRSVREGDTVRKVFVASGEAALHAAELEAGQRTRQEAMRRELDLQNARIDRLERNVAEIDQMVHQLSLAVILDAGYYRPSRHFWRKRCDA